MTLDSAVTTDHGKSLAPFVLDFKAKGSEEPPPDGLARLLIRPIKGSKFLWAAKV